MKTILFDYSVDIFEGTTEHEFIKGAVRSRGRHCQSGFYCVGLCKALHRCGAKVAVTWLNAKAEVYVRPLAEQLGAEIMLPLDVTNPDQLEAVFSEIDKRWGGLTLWCILLPLHQKMI